MAKVVDAVIAALKTALEDAESLPWPEMQACCTCATAGTGARRSPAIAGF